MPATAAELLQEFELESVTTRRVHERVPTEQLTWKPHPKSRSLGQLALHVAIGPGLISQWALQDSMEMPEMGEPSQPTSNAFRSWLYTTTASKRSKPRCRRSVMQDWEPCGSCSATVRRSWCCQRVS